MSTAAAFTSLCPRSPQANPGSGRHAIARSRSTTVRSHGSFSEAHSFVFIDILALFPQKSSFQLSAAPLLAGADPVVWGLRSPEGTGQNKRCNLTKLRLRRIADVQKQRLRQPTTFYRTLCFHRHSRFVPRNSE
ncbi:exported hypothetical protein [Acidobacteriia bacterium SbA2]|nr:exported hypothetical protein [Acidobacteriia bacterium SbA2]